MIDWQRALLIKWQEEKEALQVRLQKKKKIRQLKRQEEKEAEALLVKRQEEKEAESKSKNKEILRCDFCGKKAKQIIVDIKGKIVHACFRCIPANYHGLPWIKSVKKI